MARTGSSPRSAAQGFADHLNDVLNRTVTDGRLALVPVPGHETQFLLQRMVNKRAAPLVLRPSPLRLFVRQAIQVVDGHCQTESYIYRLQRSDETQSWMLRWEYLRQPPPKPEYLYVRQHVHVNAELLEDLPQPVKALPRLHIPTGRVPIESVLQHLIVEWGVKARLGWEAVLDESRSGFHERATAP